MLTINILCVGKIKENYLKEAINEYSKRLSKYCNLNIIEVSDEKVPDRLSDTVIKNIKDQEANKMLSYLKKDTYCISLDLKGKELTSEEFSKRIEEISNISSNYKIRSILLDVGRFLSASFRKKSATSTWSYCISIIRL